MPVMAFGKIMGLLYRCISMDCSNFKLGCSVIYLSVVYPYREEFCLTKIYQYCPDDQ